MKITIYTIPDCSYCHQEKEYLTSKGLLFEEKDVQANKDFLSELLERSNKFAGVPFTMFEDSGKTASLKGFTQSEFDETLANLQSAGAGIAPKTDSPMTSQALSTPASMPKSTLVSTPVSTPQSTPPSMPQNVPSSMVSTPLSNDSAVQSIPKPPVKEDIKVSPLPDLSMPATVAAQGGMVGNNAPADPQAELDTILKDLQTKTEPVSTQDSGVSPAPVEPAPATPVVPAMPPAPQTMTPSPVSRGISPSPLDSDMSSAPTPTPAPDIPDFTKTP